MNSTEKNYHFK